MNHFFRRKFVLTHKKVQIQLASVFLLWFVAFISVFAWIFFMNYQGLAERAEGMRIHDELLTKMLLVKQNQNLALWYGLAALGYVGLVWAYLLVYSHRLTGPVFKMTKILEKATEAGTWPTRVKFRKGDAFGELAEAFNQFADRMQEGEAVDLKPLGDSDRKSTRAIDSTWKARETSKAKIKKKN